MKPYHVNRNKSKDYFILIPALFLLAGGIYFLVDGKNNQFILGLCLTLVAGLVTAFILFKLIQNKPFIVFNEKGIYLKTVSRIIAWENVNGVKLIEEEKEEDLDKDVTKVVTVTYFSVFEITERNANGNYGYERKIRTDFTNHEPEDILRVAKKYLSTYNPPL